MDESDEAEEQRSKTDVSWYDSPSSSYRLSMPGGSGGSRNSCSASANAEPGWTWRDSSGLVAWTCCWQGADRSGVSASGMLPKAGRQDSN